MPLPFAPFDMRAWRHGHTRHMTDYRDNRVPGETFFFTVRLRDRGSTLLTEHLAAFGDAVRQARGRRPFHLDAWVVLPDHAHAIWTLPPADHDCASRWRAVKIAFSKALRKAGLPDANDGAVWQRHFQDYRVADDAEYATLVDYLHANPLRHGLCQRAADWPWSSLHRFVSAGIAIPDLPATLAPPWAQTKKKDPKALFCFP